jgi:toxin ParE1/3/4
MSSPKAVVVLTDEAQDDYANLLLYSAQEWGLEQRDRYDAALIRAFHTLGDNPQIGRARDDLFPDCRAYLVERHIIYYALFDLTLVVLRILHTRADARQAFRAEP